MGRQPFSLEQLRTFLAVSRHQSMSGAAVSLFLTQSAVSQQVTHLEAGLGLRLLERSGGRVRLTDAGSAIASACEAVIRAADTVSETARMMTSLEAGSLHVGASPTVAGHYLPRLLLAFSSRYEHVRVNVVAANVPTLAGQVAAGVLDCAVVEGPAEYPDLLEHRLTEDVVVVVVSPGHPLAARSAMAMSDLVNHRYLSREPGAALETMAMEVMGDRYDRPERIELDHLDAVRGAALQGLGYAFLPRVAIARELDDGSLVELPIPARQRWISAVRRRSVGAAALEEFWRILQDPIIYKSG